MFMPLDALTPSSPTPQTEPCSDELQRHRLLLNEMIEIGVDRIRLVHRLEQTRIDAALARLADEPGSRPTITPEDELKSATAYGCHFRAVRRGMLLARRLAEPVRTPAQADHAQRNAARRRILRTLEDDIHHEWRGETADQLHEEVLDRLDSPEIEDEIGTRSPEEIIADIRRDLQLGAPPGTRRPWRRRTPEDIAELHARAAKPPGSEPRPAAKPRAIWPQDNTPRGGKQPLPEDPAEAIAVLLQDKARLPDD